MKLVALETARVIFLSPLEEMRPFAGVPHKDFITAARDRYDFLEVPDLTKPLQELQAGPLFFREGKVNKGNEVVLIQEIAVYRDGIVIRAHHTDDCELILDDVLTWARTTFRLRELDSAPTKNYVSTVIVDFERDISSIIGPYRQLLGMLSERLKAYRKIDQPVAMNRISFAVDATRLSAGTIPTEFLIERRQNVPFEKNRFFCDAPLPTDVHLKLLADIEALAPNPI